MAGTIRGQIIDQSTGLPLDGAVITLQSDTGKADRSDLFGFYTLADVAEGTQTIDVNRRGYLPKTSTITVGSELASANAALTPDPSLPPNDSREIISLVISIVDAKSNVPIGGVPVVAQHAMDSFSGSTTGDGTLILEDVPEGAYTFLINQGGRAGWETYTSASHTIGQSHHINVQLKHIPQDLTLTVRGCDPSTQEERGLEGVYVELEGVDPEDEDIVVVPKRTLLSDGNGEVHLNDLCPIHWKVKTIRYGYQSVDETLTPGGGDQLPSATTLTLPMRQTGLHLTLTSDYQTNDFYEGIEVIVEGVAESNTEGIRRTLDSPLEGDEANVRSFPKLLPGRYIVTVNDTFEPADPSTMAAPHFTTQTVVEAIDNEMTEVDLTLDVKRALVRGRLFAAQGELVKVDSPGGLQAFGREPVYEAFETEGIALVAASVFQENLLEEARKPAADSNAAGEFLIEVLPGSYGVGLESLTEHYGSHCVLRHQRPIVGADGSLTTEETTLKQEWPMFDTWPDTFANGPPVGITGNPGVPLVINSEGDYDLSLYLHPKTVTMWLQFVTQAGAPTENLVQGMDPDTGQIVTVDFNEAVANPAMLTLGGQTKPVKLFDGFALAEFEDLQPGSHSWSGSHPRFTIGPTIQGPDGEVPDFGDLPDIPGIPNPGDASIDALINALQALVVTLQVAGATELAAQYQEALDDLLASQENGGGNNGPDPGMDGDLFSTEFTIPEWPDYPGKAYPTDPGLAFPFIPTLLYQRVPTPNNAVAQYKSTGTVKVIELTWQDEATGMLEEGEEPHYEDDAGNDSDFIEREITTFGLIQPDYAEGALFAGGGRPLGSFTHWEGGRPLRVEGSGDVTITLYHGGPQENTGDFVPPHLNKTLTIRALNDNAPDEEISGIELFLGTQEQMFTTGTKAAPTRIQIPQQYDGALRVARVNVPAQDWVPQPGFDVIQSGTFNTEVTLVVRLSQGVDVEGSVTNAITGVPLEGVRVRAYERFGQALAGAGVLTASDGSFDFGEPAEEVGVFFLEFTALGFLPKRIRYGVNDPAFTVDPGKPNIRKLNAMVELTPRSLPDIEPFGDRFGSFLPYVSAKSTQGLGPIQAEEELTLTWEAQTGAPDDPVTVLPFDAFDGAAQEAVTETMTDPIALIALVDPRIFPPDPSEMAGTGAEAATGQAAPQDVIDFLPPDELTTNDHDVQGRRRWWDAITSQMFPSDGALLPNGYFLTMHLEDREMRVGQPDGELNGGGQVLLSSIHPGKYNPYLVVETVGGAVGITRLVDEDSEPDKVLRGLRAPQYLSFVGDFMALAQRFSGSDNFKDYVKDITPDGRFVPLPNITGEISEENGFLTYDYRFALQWKEGMQMPGKNYGGMGLGYAGAVIEGSAGLKLEGKDNKLTLDIAGQASTTPPEERNDAFLPRIVPQRVRDTLDPKFTMTGGGETNFAQVYDPEANPLEMQTQLCLNVGAKLDVSYDLKPYVARLPQIGPFITTLDFIDPKALTIAATGSGALGVKSISTWTTKYPMPSGPTGGQPENGSILGGDEDLVSGSAVRTFTQDFDLCMSLGIGLELDVAKTAGGSIGLVLEGENCEIPIVGGGVPGMNFTTNFGSWPPLKEVSGKLNAHANLYLDVWVKRFAAERTWELFEFTNQFGTESRLQVVPISNTIEVIERTTGPGSTLDPDNSTQPLTDLIPGGVASLTNGGIDLLVHTDVNPDTGMIQLKVTPRLNDGQLGTSSKIAENVGIIAADVALLPNGDVLGVWSTVNEADLTNPFASQSEVYFAKSTDAGATWSAPMMIDSPDKVVNAIDLLVTENLTVALCAGVTSVFGDGQVLYGTRYAEDAWNDPVLLLPEGPIHDHAGLAIDGKIIVASINDTSVLGVSWDGTGAPETIALSDQGGSAIAIDSQSPDQSTVAWGKIDGGLGFAAYAQGAWSAGDPMYPNIQADELSMLSQGAFTHLAWTHSGQIFTATLGNEPTPLTNNTAGLYQNLHLSAPSNDDGIVVSSVFQLGTSQELRTFLLGPDGTARSDRDNDGVNDFAELRLVDANPDDALRSLTDLDGSGDFDRDGLSDAEEIASGSDPTSPDRPIDPGTDLPSERWLAENAPGQSWLARDASGRTLLERYATTDKPIEIMASPNGSLSLTYTQPRDANVIYTLQTGDGATWTNQATTETARQLNDDGTDTVTLTFPTDDARVILLGRLHLELDL